MTHPAAGPHVPYARRRNTPAQLSALHGLFEATPHPTRTQRQALANEIGMELKSVTNWFQNRRQTSRRKSSSENSNNPTKARSPTHHQQRRSKTPLDRTKISLDRIAALSERPSPTLQLNSQRLPLTPRKNNVQQRNPSSPLELWRHMLSSPAVPPSVPDPEEARLAALSSRAKTLCPLEWACLNARQKKWVDEDVDGSFVSGDGVDCGLSAVTFPQDDRMGQEGKRVLFSRPQFEDVEAAITLLGFKTRS